MDIYAMRDQILALRAEGKSYNQIQKALGCAHSVIAYHCSPTTKQKSIENTKNRRKHKSKTIAEIKSKLKCCICGEHRYWLLDFHHRDPNEKDFNVSKIMRYKGMELMLKEIEKCDVLCANCHRDMHYRIENGLPTDHDSIRRDLETNKTQIM